MENGKRHYSSSAALFQDMGFQEVFAFNKDKTPWYAATDQDVVDENEKKSKKKKNAKQYKGLYYLLQKGANAENFCKFFVENSTHSTPFRRARESLCKRNPNQFRSH